MCLPPLVKLRIDPVVRDGVVDVLIAIGGWSESESGDGFVPE